MKIECKDLERVLRDQEPAKLAALEEHAQSCAACAEELRLWNEISAAAQRMRKSWETPELWPKIRQALAEQPQAPAHAPVWWNWRWLLQSAGQQWRIAVATLALIVVSASGAWMLLHKPQPPASSEEAQRLLNEQAVREVEAAEAAYLKSIDKLAAAAGPKIEQPTTPLMASYREKLLLIDAAIAECRSNIEQNRSNAHLRQELLAMYQEKQRTLQDVIKEN